MNTCAFLFYLQDLAVNDESVPSRSIRSGKLNKHAYVFKLTLGFVLLNN